MAKIISIAANEILDSKGLPTIEATVVLSDGKIGTASCPSDKKISSYEAVSLRDNDEKQFEGQSVNKAIENINKILAPALVGKEAVHQQEIDKTMIDHDGTQNKSRLGANAILAVSMAVAKAAAESSGLPLFLYLKQFLKKDHGHLKIPIPIFNLISGNQESNFADFYEYLVIPASSKHYLESIQIAEAIWKSLKLIIETKYNMTLDNFEGTFSPSLTTNKEAFSLIQQAVENTNVKLGFDVFFGLDSKASTFYRDGKYHVKDSLAELSSNDLLSYYEELNQNFHLFYIEDPFDKDDLNGWVSFFDKFSSSAIIAAGDMVSTNPYRLQMVIDKKIANGIVLKPNQIGTIIESLAIAEAVKESGFKIITSHTSNETNDDFLADFSVAVGADYTKIGCLSRGENIAKYNRLLQIENQLKIL